MKLTKGPFKGYEVKTETRGKLKTVKCNHCGHKFSATFFRKDPDPNDVAYCPKCNGMDFEWA